MTLINEGTIEGFTDSGDGNMLDFFGFPSDEVTNNGTITGDVSLGAGNDSFLGTGSVSGVVYGGLGNDNLVGSDSAHRFRGGLGNDFLEGGTGNSPLFGELGNDTFVFSIDGSSNEEDLYDGGFGTDTLLFEYDFSLENDADFVAARDGLVAAIESGSVHVVEYGDVTLAVASIENIALLPTDDFGLV